MASSCEVGGQVPMLLVSVLVLVADRSGLSLLTLWLWCVSVSRLGMSPWGGVVVRLD